MSLIIIVAAHAPNVMPLLYYTEGERVVPESLYTAWGSGKRIADYLADRLYQHGLHKDMLGLLAAFIFREAADSSVGVGRKTDMIFIHEGDKSLHVIPPNKVREIEEGVPSLADAIYDYWNKNTKVPEWLTKLLA